MKKIILSAAVIGAMFSSTAFAQLQDEKDVTITMDLQPILQLNMSTPSQIDFVFDDINDYYAGITKYAATVLKVSSTVSWDLYAIGNSTGNQGAGMWDQHVEYGAGGAGAGLVNAVDALPLSLLELRQRGANTGATGATGAFADYSAQFPTVLAPSGANSLYVDPANANTPPTADHKYIAGHFGTTGDGVTDGMAGGSYLTSTANSASSNFYYTIDYRILPGLPAVFPMAFAADGTTAQDLVTINGAGAYAQPGVYTMYVQYLLLEDQ